MFTRRGNFQEVSCSIKPGNITETDKKDTYPSHPSFW